MSIITLHTRSLQRLLDVALVILLLGLLSACGIGTRTRALLGKKLRVQVQVSEAANQKSPVALDLLLVYDKKLLKELLQLSANEWFDRRRQFRRNYPNGKGFNAWEWEWSPGQNVAVQELPLMAKAKGGLVFARYFAPGEHRVQIEPTKSIRIDLLEEAFTVTPL
ncbi:MAG: hypothetical protein OEU26_15800 [Candidatus Tectomicrobia bacterium]|nr:hypothetical protein [Candidatus Tectomicrobia bacterium]